MTCPKLDTCEKIEMLASKDYAVDGQYAEAIQQVCEICTESYSKRPRRFKCLTDSFDALSKEIARQAYDSVIYEGEFLKHREGLKRPSLASEFNALEGEIRQAIVRELRSKMRYNGTDNCGYYTISLRDWHDFKEGK